MRVDTAKPPDDQRVAPLGWWASAGFGSETSFRGSQMDHHSRTGTERGCQVVRQTA